MEAGGSTQSPKIGSRRPSRQVLAIAVTALLALGVGTIVAALILSGGARPSGEGDGSASPAASVVTSGVPPNTEPSPSVVPSLANAELLQATVTGLRMRAAASTSAELIRTLDLGEVVRVVSGPVNADGYGWYEVIDLDSNTGWAAMGSGAEPWLEAVPPDPATSGLLLRLERNCDVGIRDVGIPVIPADVAVTADGRVLQISGVVRQLSLSGLAQVRRDVLELPALQTSATYDLELRPGAEPPGHGACVSTFTLGEGTARVVVSATNWQGDEEEAAYWLPSPERRALDELTMQLVDIEAWLGPAAWSEPAAHRYVSGSYLFWRERSGDVPPPDVVAPSVASATWPFDGPIEQFGQAVGLSRCGYLDLGQAFETLRLMRNAGVTTYTYGVETSRELSLDGFGAGNFTTDAGWFGFWLTPRSPDSFPACPN